MLTPDQLTDNVLRVLWKESGGGFHGPVVEYGFMAEAKLLPFLRTLQSKASQVEELKDANQKLSHALKADRDTAPSDEDWKDLRKTLDMEPHTTEGMRVRRAIEEINRLRNELADARAQFSAAMSDLATTQRQVRDVTKEKERAEEGLRKWRDEALMTASDRDEAKAKLAGADQHLKNSMYIASEQTRGMQKERDQAQAELLTVQKEQKKDQEAAEGLVQHLAEARAKVEKTSAALAQALGQIEDLEKCIPQKNALITEQREQIEALTKKADALQAFKGFVHLRLDEMGIPQHPNGPHSAAGCRIGDRLDIVRSWIRAARWNIREEAGALIVCKNEHEKHEPCNEVCYVPKEWSAQAEAKVVRLQESAALAEREVERTNKANEYLLRQVEELKQVQKVGGRAITDLGAQLEAAGEALKQIKAECEDIPLGMPSRGLADAILKIATMREDKQVEELKSVTAADALANLMNKVEELTKELEAEREAHERARVQLAGCGAAALGYDGGCKPQDYGHSASFSDVQQLRVKYDEACAQIGRSLQEAEASNDKIKNMAELLRDIRRNHSALLIPTNLSAEEQARIAEVLV